MRRTLLLVGALLSARAGAAQTRSGLADVGDARIHYELSGVEKARTVVFVHGWANTLAIWDNVVPEFSKHYRVLRYDRRGYGESTGDADPSTDPDDLRILMDSLRIRSAYVVGLSAGAGVALRFAFAFPHRIDALVFNGGGPPPGFPLATDNSRATWASIANTYGLDSLGKFIEASPLVWRPSNRSPDERRRDSLWFWTNWAHYNGRDLTHPRPQSGRVPSVEWTRISTLTVPMLILNGDHDLAMARIVGDSLARRVPGAHRVVIKDAGHAAHLLQPERFCRTVLDFLAERDSVRVLDLGDARLAYRLTGRGRPVVFIPGWTQGMGAWDEQVTAFTPEYQVIRYDPRGFGLSTGDADVTADAADLLALLDTLRVTRAAAIGLSQGSSTALNFAVNFPERVGALVLYGASPDPTMGYPVPPPPELIQMLSTASATATAFTVDSVFRYLLSTPIAWMPPNRPDILPKLERGSRYWTARDLTAPVTPSGRVQPTRLEQINGVAVPTLVLHGDHELAWFRQFDDTLMARLPHARRVIISDAGHGAHFAQPDRFNRVVLEFLRAAGW